MVIIYAPHFVAAVLPGVDAAPIVRYMGKWSLDRILEYCNRKGWDWRVSI